MKVPGHVLLPSDSAWDGETVKGVIGKNKIINSEMELLRQRIKTTLFKKAKLNQQLTRVKKVLEMQEKKIKHDADTMKSKSVDDWKDIADFNRLIAKEYETKRKELLAVSGDLSSLPESSLALTETQRDTIKLSTLNLIRELKAQSVK